MNQEEAPRQMGTKALSGIMSCDIVIMLSCGFSGSGKTMGQKRLTKAYLTSRKSGTSMVVHVLAG
ncbi:hypothetical protein EON65_24895 [archaeon]|nr:MAG: hypothetical protein EON65_24895 [archaeon]